MAENLRATAKASQEVLPIEEIRDGILLLKGGGLRALLMCSSINFALKSADEQDALLIQYQTLLNTLDFSLQFFVHSRHLNIEPYLDALRDVLKQQTNELVRIQTTEYIEFIKNLVENTNVVNKTFYAVIPYDPVSVKINVGFLGKLFGGSGGKTTITQEKFEEQRAQIGQRIDIVHQGLARLGVRSVMLNTEELIELFYGLYNPGESQRGGAPHVTGEPQ